MIRAAKWGGGAIAALLLLAMLAVWAIDTGPGHRFLIDRIERMAPKSGLKIRIGRIDGSIYSRARIRDLRIYDAQGLLFDTPDLALHWQPWSWLRNKLEIYTAHAPLATLHKSPKFNPSEKKGPILPGFDIGVGSLRIDRLRFEPAIAGTRRIGSLRGSADIRDGRAKIDLDAAVEGGGDRLMVRMDAEPDRDDFDLEVRLNAPANSVFGAIAGTKRAIALVVTGDGTWSGWKGKGLLDLSGNRVVALDLAADKGTYSLGGFVAPSLISQGKVQRLTAPMIRVDGRGTLIDRRLEGTLSLASRALRIRGEGALDLARSAFDDVRLTADLLQPAALFPNMSGQRIQLRALLDGGFDTARFEYLLTAPRVAFDNTGFEEVRAAGKGRFGPAPISVPLSLTARRVTGLGDVAGGILRNLSVNGVLKVTAKTLIGDGLVLRSDKLTSKVSLFIDLVNGRYEVTISGQLNRYLIPGLGIVDVKTTLSVVPGANGRGTRVVGRGQVWVRRLDNSFLRGLAGGLPYIDTGLERGPDGILYLRNLKLTAPAIRLTGNGFRRTDGTFHLEGSGAQSQYGSFRLVLDGQIDRPKIDLLLARPLDALGLADVRLNLDPTAQGFTYRAAGGSRLGPFTSVGAILLPSGQPATIRIDDLKVSGTTAKGSLRSLPGGFDGQLAVAGGGLDGALTFAPVGGNQQIAIDLRANGAKFAGPPEISIRRGRVQGTILLDPAATTINGTVNAGGIRYGNIALSRLQASATMRGGTGQVTAALAGARGRAFDLKIAADIAPGRIRLTGDGTIDRRPVKLTTPAVLTAEGDAWRLARTGIEFAGGSASVAGLFGGNGSSEIDAALQRMPLSILDMAYPDLGLSGTATGTLRYAKAPGQAVPTGRADLKIRGLARAGLVLSSKPIDLGIAAVLTPDRAVARAVAASGGQTIGRAQLRIAPLGGSGDLMQRLIAAPLFAQVRYNGPADTLWRLTGVEIFDLSGPVAIGADMSGTLGNPSIRGSVRAQNARLESSVTGTVLTNVRATGTFGGSRLVLSELSANAGNGGTVSGRGSFNLGAAEGFGIDLALDARNAVLINRDDIGATVTGPITIRTDGRGGVIAGQVDLVRSRYVLGRASAASTIPRLNVRELNRRGDVIERPEAAVPWRLDLKANARNRLMVSGLGLDSEWRADLDIGGTVESPAITGRADLIRGNYDFAGRSFDLERGTIRFAGESPPNPTIDIAAQASIQGLNATIRVTGSGLNPQISFTSVPALPEDELLSRLLFGTSITNLSAPEALQLAAAVAALQGGGGGLDPINAVRRSVGLDRLRILPADTITGQGTSIAAGKYVTRRTYVELITDGQGYSATRIEYQVTRWLSLLASISTIGRQSVNVRVSKDY